MKRCDGRRLKTVGTFVRMLPYIMVRRSDAQVFTKQTIYTDKIDKYLREKHEQKQEIHLLHFFIALYARVIAERPQLNRFIMNSQIFARNGIVISMAVKRKLDDEGEETTVKFSLTGKEDIFEIARIVNDKIKEGIKVSDSHTVDKIAAVLMSLPGFTKKILVGTLKLMDKHNLLPKAVIEASPFHTSLFFTYLKSIRLDYVYHHLYDFGTTGIFVALGKENYKPVLEDDKLVNKKYFEIGYVLDERICDGLYFANSLKLVKKYLDNPYLLETGLDEIVSDVK